MNMENYQANQSKICAQVRGLILTKISMMNWTSFYGNLQNLTNLVGIRLGAKEDQAGISNAQL